MFERTGDDGSRNVAGEAEEGEIIGFGGAAGEEDVVGFGVEASGDAAAGVVEGLARGPAESVAAGVPTWAQV